MDGRLPSATREPTRRRINADNPRAGRQGGRLAEVHVAGVADDNVIEELKTDQGAAGSKSARQFPVQDWTWDRQKDDPQESQPKLDRPPVSACGLDTLIATNCHDTGQQ